MTEKQRKIPWGRLALEMLSIIIGVLVALAVDEWNEEREYRQQARTALENIHQELEKNLRIIELIHPGNQAAMEAIMTESTEDDSMTIIPGLQIQDAAWQTMVSSGIAAHVPYDDLYEIAEAYTVQSVYKSFSEELVRSIINSQSLAMALGNKITQEEAVKANVEQLAMFLTVEEQLLEFLRAILESPIDGNDP